MVQSPKPINDQEGYCIYIILFVGSWRNQTVAYTITIQHECVLYL